MKCIEYLNCQKQSHNSLLRTIDYTITKQLQTIVGLPNNEQQLHFLAVIRVVVILAVIRVQSEQVNDGTTT